MLFVEGVLPGRPKNHGLDEINESVFRHLVDLAALHLEAGEREYLRRELNGQLKAIRELEAIEIEDDVSITSHGVPYTQRMRLPLRQDRIEESAAADEILQQAPAVDERSIVVPDIPHEDLD